MEEGEEGGPHTTCRRFVVKVCFFSGLRSVCGVGGGGLEKGSENEAVHVRLSCQCGWFFRQGDRGPFREP